MHWAGKLACENLRPFITIRLLLTTADRNSTMIFKAEGIIVSLLTLIAHVAATDQTASHWDGFGAVATTAADVDILLHS